METLERDDDDKTEHLLSDRELLIHETSEVILNHTALWGALVAHRVKHITCRLCPNYSSRGPKSDLWLPSAVLQ